MIVIQVVIQEYENVGNWAGSQTFASYDSSFYIKLSKDCRNSQKWKIKQPTKQTPMK